MSYMPLGGVRRDLPPETIVQLVEAALNSDFAAVRRLSSALTGHLQDPERGEVEERLRRLFRGDAGGRPQRLAAPLDLKTRSPLIEELPWPTMPLFLDEEDSEDIQRFIDEAKAADVLAAAGLAPRSNLLLVGPPGTGKTLTAGHIAARLGLPFRVARLDAMVSSLLGDTAKNIRSVLDFVQRERGLLFLDEIDAVAKQRDDAHDVGELKRVVNTLLQGLDRLEHGCIIIAATNHGHLLDPAVWRRFPYRVVVGLPSEPLRAELWRHYLALGDRPSVLALAKMSEGLSCSDICELSLAARRTAVLAGTDVSLPSVVAALVHCVDGKFSLPRVGKLDRDACLGLRSIVKDRFKASAGQISDLFDVTSQAVTKHIRGKRQTAKRGDGFAQQSGSAPHGGGSKGVRSGRR